VVVLVELHIENLGIIERLELVVGSGLTALTGETGAGKTMLVEAIELVVGGRADSSMVRPGALEARVDARFVTADEHEVVLTRVVPVDGRSRAYVNGRVATVASLAELAGPLIDLHGQHAHQTLLSTTTQRSALDRFGAIDLSGLRAARARLTELDAELATLGGDERTRAREIDLLRFQVAELDAAGLVDPHEDVSLDQLESTLADAVAHREAGAAALEALTADGAARDALATALDVLGSRAPFGEIVERLHTVLLELEDVSSVLRGAAEAIEEDPARLAEVRARRQALRDLCRKYGDDLAEVMSYHATVEDRLRSLEGFDQRALELDRLRHEAMEAERREAQAVGRQRREAAPRLAAAVEERLRDLAMPSASIAVRVGDGPDDHPGDRVEFLLSANPGSPMLPLARVASGGELARAMLALRLALTGAGAGGEDGATLVFDEVDAGIGGAAASAVAAALGSLAAEHQILVVTHLAQVAAVADRQVVVAKEVRGGSTFASAVPVEGDVRVTEVARMLAGDDSDAARSHARTLLTRP
jgi:DNA repair protein RecN (Recombination protein N)